MSVNKKIIDFIQVKGLKSVEIAKRIGISRQNLSRILNSDDLKVSQLIEISKHLDVSPTYFLDGVSESDSKELEQLKDENKLLKTQLKLIESNFKQLVELNYRRKVDVINTWFSRKYKKDILELLLREVKEDYKKAISMSSDVSEIIKLTYSTENVSIIKEFNNRIDELLNGKNEETEMSKEDYQQILELTAFDEKDKIGLDSAKKINLS